MVIRSFSLANESELLGSHSQRPNQLELPISQSFWVCGTTQQVTPAESGPRNSYLL
eukprot:COSAG02_NODE_1567_length_11900_cov_6.050250_9_plen_56_part_00